MKWRDKTSMNKRYQIFISSTYEDLKEERTLLIQTILRKGHYPAGMEWFPGIDEEQFEYIKQVIDDSDYYVVIVGGLYGSIASDGVSYTEKEYDYAVKQGKKIIALVQKEPPIMEKYDKQKIKIMQFRQKVIDKRLGVFWNNQQELISIFATSLEESIHKFPMQGWLRCNSDSCTERLEFIDMNEKISSLKLKKINTIHIMASGTSSYIPIVKNLLKINKQKKDKVDIFIYFRLGKDSQRVDYFKNQYNNWWNTIKNEYSNINFHFSCIDDFKISFRGVIINQEVGLIGFYIRENGITLGTLEDSIFVDKYTDVGRYILKYCLKCFDDQQEGYSSLRSCIDNSIKMH